MEGKYDHSNMLNVLEDMTFGLMDNFRRTILTCDLDKKLYNQPLEKHIYHAMYWFDYWCCTPQNFVGADFHCDNLDSLDIESAFEFTKENLLSYFESIKCKTISYLENLTEDNLNDIVENCDNKSRFECVLGQFHHVSFHLGNVNAMTIEDTGKWPYVSARKNDYKEDLFE